MDTSRLKGSIVPLVTPFDAHGRFDERTLKKLVEWQIASGSNGISVTGSTGEPGSLSFEEKQRIYRSTVDVVSRRVPVVAGTGTNNLEETLKLSKAAEDEGVDALLVLVPYYSKPNQVGLHEYFVKVASYTELPVIIYNIPGRTAANIEPSTVARIREDCKNVVGVKEANRDLDQMSKDIASCGNDFLVYSGIESYCFPLLSIGGAGYFSATANILPAELAQLFKLCRAGKWMEAKEMHYRMLPINEALFWETNPVPVKTALGMMGKITPTLRLPLVPLDQERKERLASVMRDYSLLGGKAGR
jgi:4-hydroxy-tetrahydrodipicolinate synthase